MTQTYKCPVLVQAATCINLSVQIKFHSLSARAFHDVATTNRPFITMTISRKEYTRDTTIHNYIHVRLLNFLRGKIISEKNCVQPDVEFFDRRVLVVPKNCILDVGSRRRSFTKPHVRASRGHMFGGMPE